MSLVMSSILGNLSWKYKVAIIAALPLLVTTISSLIFAYSMLEQNNEMRAATEQTNIRQQQAGKTLVDILKMQTAIQQLIASDTKQEIRKSAIATIKVSAAIDEHIQLLQEEMPNNEQVNSLANDLELIKPKQLT